MLENETSDRPGHMSLKAQSANQSRGSYIINEASEDSLFCLEHQSEAEEGIWISHLRGTKTSN